MVTSNPSALKALFSLALLSTRPPCDGGVLGWAKKTTVTGFVLEIMFIHTFYCLLGKNICNESVIPSLSPWLSFREEKSLWVQVISYHLKFCFSSNSLHIYNTTKLKCKFVTAVSVGVHATNRAPD